MGPERRPDAAGQFPSADSGLTGYDARPTLDDGGWKTLLNNLDRISALATEQDTILTEEPPGEGPAADVRTSAEYSVRC